MIGREVFRLCRTIGCKAEHRSQRGRGKQEDLQSITNKAVSATVLLIADQTLPNRRYLTAATCFMCK